jgi:hypothetical protein
VSGWFLGERGGEREGAGRASGRAPAAAAALSGNIAPSTPGRERGRARPVARRACGGEENARQRTQNRPTRANMLQQLASVGARGAFACEKKRGGGRGRRGREVSQNLFFFFLLSLKTQVLFSHLQQCERAAAAAHAEPGARHGGVCVRARSSVWCFSLSFPGVWLCATKFVGGRRGETSPWLALSKCE